MYDHTGRGRGERERPPRLPLSMIDAWQQEGERARLGMMVPLPSYQLHVVYNCDGKMIGSLTEIL